MKRFYNKLDRIINFLNNNRFVYNHNNNYEGRINSLLSESEVLKKIYDQFDYVSLTNNKRDLGDFYINHGDKKFPVNLKLISENNKSCNNLVGLPRIMKYLFFEDQKIPISYVGISKAIKNKNYSKRINDYGILVLVKETGYTYGGSLLRIKKITTNPTNGFQFKEISNINRKRAASKKFIIDNYKCVLKKRAEPYMILNDD
jgi:hypothetical protein